MRSVRDGTVDVVVWAKLSDTIRTAIHVQEESEGGEEMEGL